MVSLEIGRIFCLVLSSSETEGSGCFWRGGRTWESHTHRTHLATGDTRQDAPIATWICDELRAEYTWREDALNCSLSTTNIRALDRTSHEGLFPIIVHTHPSAVREPSSTSSITTRSSTSFGPKEEIEKVRWEEEKDSADKRDNVVYVNFQKKTKQVPHMNTKSDVYLFSKFGRMTCTIYWKEK